MPVVVKGLDKFRRELRRADKRMGKAFQKANKKVSERVVSKGKPAVRGLPSPGGSIAARGVRPRARQNRVTVAFSSFSCGSRPSSECPTWEGRACLGAAAPPRRFKD